MDDLSRYIIIRGKGGKHKLLIVSGTQPIYADGHKIGDALTAFLEFEGEPSEVVDYIAQQWKGNKTQ